VTQREPIDFRHVVTSAILLNCTAGAILTSGLSLGPLSGLLQKKWARALFVILLIALAIETIIIVIFIFDASLGSQSFPRFSFNPPIAANCASLSHQVVSSNSDNRTVLFDCSTPTSSVAAFRVFAPFTPTFVHENGKDDPARPFFTLPPGYLNLAITSDSDYALTCLASKPTALSSGKTIIIGEYAEVYDYCAVISNSASQTLGFSITWAQGTPPPPTPYFSTAASPSNITISAGEDANSTITLTSYYGFSGNLTLSTEVTPWNATNPPSASIDQTTVYLPPNGYAIFTLTVATTSSTVKGSYLAWVVVDGESESGVLVNVRA
jgi:hypothetical protein